MSAAAVGLDDFRISEVGTDGDKWREAQFPCVAFEDETGEFLVVWKGDGLVDSDYEAFGQRIATSLMGIFVWD